MNLVAEESSIRSAVTHFQAMRDFVREPAVILNGSLVELASKVNYEAFLDQLRQTVIDHLSCEEIDSDANDTGFSGESNSEEKQRNPVIKRHDSIEEVTDQV